MMEVPEIHPQVQQQLIHIQEELDKANEERSRALQELEEVKKMMASQKDVIEDLTRRKDSLSMLEAELGRAKESESKMLESLISQTEQLENTKISLEESKLEIRSLRQSIKIMESSAFVNARSLGKHGKLDAVPGQEEIEYLQTELKSALEAEEKSKKAMDDLALALKEVATESNRVKERLSKTQHELASAKSEAERSNASLKRTEEKLQVALEESNRLKLEAEESFSTWIEKENGFIKCMKISEEEITTIKEENDRLISSQRLSREEISKLRDIVKQAINEATVVKEALEIARNENSQLKDILSDRDIALQRIKQEYECLKVSEAAALDSVKELNRLLVAASSVDLRKTSSSFECGSFRNTEGNTNGVRVPKQMVKFPSEQWRGENPRVTKVRRYSLGEPLKFEGYTFEATEAPERKKEQSFSSVSDVSGSKANSSVDSDDGSTVIFSEFEHMDELQLHNREYEHGSPNRQKKRRQIMWRFGDLLRRGFTSNPYHALFFVFFLTICNIHVAYFWTVPADLFIV